MTWQRAFTDKLADILRFIAYVFLFIDAIILAAFSLWFVAKFIWHMAQWIDRLIFSRPW